jgi:hypothetical protein
MEHLLLRIALWLRRPPSRRQIVVILVVVAMSLCIGTIDKLGWWPDRLHVNKALRLP